MAEPAQCLMHPAAADTWGLTVVLFGIYLVVQWLLSLRTMPTTGTSDPSIVDRLWSVVPCIYVFFWCAATWWRAEVGAPTRLLLMATLCTLWGARLTWNFWAKGGYSGGEDYRWAIVWHWYPSW